MRGWIRTVNGIGIVLRNRFHLTYILLGMTLLGACEPKSDVEKNEVDIQAALSTAAQPELNQLSGSQKVVARVGEQTITLGELDNSMQLVLYDTEWRKYQLRAAQLASMMLNLNNAQQASESFLERPGPPRLEIPKSLVVTGNVEAPIRLSVFCSFQSSHCARLQAVLKQLSEQYGELLGFHYFDHPQSFHRYAKSAANAARCAHEFAIYEPFVEALYMDIANLNKVRFNTIAEQLGAARDGFNACLDEKRHQREVDSDINLSSDLGLGNVPVIFINGLYTKGILTIEDYQYFIDFELAKLSIVRHKPAQILEAQKLEISPDQNVLANDPIEDSYARPDQVVPENSSVKRVLPVTGKMTLSKNWVRRQLTERQELEKHIQNAEHVVNGLYNLVKLKDVEQQPFYVTLGLQEGDVLMQVNEEWVHSGQNPLWTALALEEPITLIIMRNGLPIRYDYVIAQD